MTDKSHRLDIEKTLGTGEDLTHPNRLKHAVVVAAGLVVAATLAAWARTEGSSRPAYRTSPVTHGRLTVTVTATGTVEPIDRVDVGSELSGIIEMVMVDYNQPVRAGQILATLDTDRLEAQELESRAYLKSVEARVQDAEATLVAETVSFDRVEELVREELSPPSELDAARAALQRARADLAGVSAQVEQAEATLNARQTELGKAVIRSPISGVVLDRRVEPGQTVAASLQAPVLFTLAEDLKQMELHVDVDEADIGRVREGQEAVFTVDAHPERSFPATISQIHFASETVDGVVTYGAVLRVDNSDLLLRPGMTATAEIVVETVENAVLIPNAALRFEPSEQAAGSEKAGGGLMSAIIPRRPSAEKKAPMAATDTSRQTVWRLDGDRPVAVSITTGATDDQRSVLVEGDLEPGLALVVETATGGRS